MKLQRSREILDRLSPKAVEIIGSPGKLREKWPLLSEEDKTVVEEALEAVNQEIDEIGKELERMDAQGR